MKYTKIPPNTFEQIQLNAGILTNLFTPSDGEIDEILGATSGGINFTATPSFVDMGEDVDNCPRNTKELKNIDTWEVKMSGTFITASSENVKLLIGANKSAVVPISRTEDQQKITSKYNQITGSMDLSSTDFKDIWWVGDYSAATSNPTQSKYIAIRMMNALSTGGFQIQTADKSKGQFSFEFTGHYSIEDPDTIPFEIYLKDEEDKYD